MCEMHTEKCPDMNMQLSEFYKPDTHVTPSLDKKQHCQHCEGFLYSIPHKHTHTYTPSPRTATKALGVVVLLGKFFARAAG